MKKKTKTEELYDSLNVGDYVWVIIYPFHIKPKYKKLSRIPVLVRTKIISKEYAFEKSMRLYTDKLNTDLLFNALNTVFKDEIKAKKRYVNLIKEIKSENLKVKKEIDEALRQ